MLCTFQLSYATKHHQSVEKEEVTTEIEDTNEIEVTTGIEDTNEIEVTTGIEDTNEIEVTNEIYFLPKINEDQEFYIVDIKNGKENVLRNNLENCRYNVNEKEIYCEFLKKFNKYQYRITIPLINEPECEIKENQKEFTKAKLWVMEKNKFVYKPNNELYTHGKTQFYSNNLYSHKRFQLWLGDEDDDCVMIADFKEASIARIN